MDKVYALVVTLHELYQPLSSVWALIDRGMTDGLLSRSECEEVFYTLNEHRCRDARFRWTAGGDVSLA